jgi:hypothetical protein
LHKTVRIDRSASRCALTCGVDLDVTPQPYPWVMSTGVLQAEEVTDLVTSVQRLAARFDPDALPDADVAGVLTDLGQVKRLVDGMVALVARRSIDVNLADGTVDGLAVSRAAREQIAAAMGSTPAEARRLLDTSVRLRDQPTVADAVREGRLSGVQAEAVSDAAAAAPGRTGDLLTAAARQTVPDLKRTCRDTRTAADPDPAATRHRHHVMRGFRSWHESDGEWKAFLSGPADAGARIEALIRRDHDQLFKAAHAERRVESDAALRFDALLQVLETGGAGTESTADAAGDTAEGDADDVGALATTRPRRGRGRGRQTQVIVRVDATSLKRGTAAADETCEIAGVGRLSVDAVRDLIPHAHIAYVIADAVDAAVVHLGRQVTAHQRTALLARGHECEVPDCRSSHLLEIDHVRDWAISRQTQLDQLAWLCRQHHKQKTHGTHRLTGPPGNRRWQPTGANVRPRGRPSARGAPGRSTADDRSPSPRLDGPLAPGPTRRADSRPTSRPPEPPEPPGLPGPPGRSRPRRRQDSASLADLSSLRSAAGSSTRGVAEGIQVADRSISMCTPTSPPGLATVRRRNRALLRCRWMPSAGGSAGSAACTESTES